MGLVVLNSYATLIAQKHNLCRKAWLKLLCDPKYDVVMRQL